MSGKIVCQVQFLFGKNICHLPKILHSSPTKFSLTKLSLLRLCKYFIPSYQQSEWILEELNKNKYLTLVPTNESKEIMKKYEELWSKVRDLISSITNNSNDYEEKYMKINFNLDDELPLNKMIEICNMIKVVRTVFHENNKYYPQAV